MKLPTRNAFRRAVFFCLVTLHSSTLSLAAPPGEPAERPRVAQLGIRIGILPPGKNNAITDVAGVLVGHATLRSGDDVRTGVTAVLPHDGNLFQEKAPAAVVVGNGFGKLVGVTQVEELGNLETPVVLTNTLSVFTAANALVDYTLRQEGNENVRSVNPVVGEELGQYYFRDLVDAQPADDGSCMIVVATDAPLDARRLKRLARRALFGLAAVGSPMTHGSGDYVIAFSTDPGLRTSSAAAAGESPQTLLADQALSPLFQAVREATEEAILNSLFRATTVTGFRGRTLEALPIDRVVEICRRYGVISAIEKP